MQHSGGAYALRERIREKRAVFWAQDVVLYRDTIPERKHGRIKPFAWRNRLISGRRRCCAREPFEGNHSKDRGEL